MASLYKGFDPKLGAAFAQESDGMVIGRRKRPTKSEDDAVEAECDADMEAFVEEHGRDPYSDQELFDFVHRDDSE